MDSGIREFVDALLVAVVSLGGRGVASSCIAVSCGSRAFAASEMKI